MKIKTIKKNDPSLLSKSGHGFFGRVLAMRVGQHYVVLRHVKGRRDAAILSYHDIDLHGMANEKETILQAIQRHYLKKYKFDLILLKNRLPLHGFRPDGKWYVIDLDPIDNQTEIYFGEDFTASCASKTEGKEDIYGAIAKRAGKASGHIGPDDVRNGAGELVPEQGNAHADMRQLELVFA